MRASILAGLLAAVSLPVEPSPSQLQTSARVLASAKALLADCPTTKYLLVAQPNVHASDLYAPPACEAHRLRRALASDAVKGRYSVSEVVSKDGVTNLTLDDFSAHIKASCAAKGVESDALSVSEINLPTLPAAPTCQDRAEAMGDNDYIVGNAVDDALALGDVTVVYFSTGGADAHGKYEAIFDGPEQAPIKKRLAPHHVVREVPSAFSTATSKKPGLFVKYQFFTPAIFMSLVVFFILMSILYVGLSAVASLQVPYGAFDKEMGPSAQKKQQ
ncbi:hypothetical protein SEUCBS139899_002325 [Sporothrix eucalyptigena]